MTTARKHLVSLDTTGYYHVITRCVRQAYLCGYDKDSDTDYEHRRQWIVDRLRALTSVFAIDIYSYSVMQTHYHLVLEVNSKEAEGLSDEDVLTRWTTLFRGPLLVQRYLRGETLTAAEQEVLGTIIADWRTRLGSLSWFMKCLNKPIAKAANTEDKRKGHFWEARFKSQALLDEAALINCMAYVDLNPVRADIAETPEASDYTSIQERIRPQFDLAQAIRDSLLDINKPNGIELKPLAPFLDGITDNENAKGIPMTFKDYLQLVDWTGRAIRPDKKGFIPPALPPILTRLQMKPEEWLNNCQHFESRLGRMVGRLKRIAGILDKQPQRKWLQKQGRFERLFDSG